jgi:hypothetical protein
MRRNHLSSLIVTWVAALILLAPSVSQADLSTPDQILSVSATKTDWGPVSHPPITALQFSQFNPSLGTLTGVSISLDYNFSSQVTLNAVNASTLTMVVQGYMVLSLPQNDGQIHNIFSPSDTPNFNNVVQHTFSGPNSYSSTQDFSNTVSTELTSSAVRAQFTGTGTIGLPIGASVPVTNFYTSTSQGHGVATTYASATVTLSYDYIPHIPIPEPSSLVLLSLAGGGMLFAAHRRRRRVIPSA